MTETQKRIKAYQKALPYMKERVVAVALLFVMSISMMASATFAWITLSRSPEISGLATTIATNGNLEIALSDKDGLEPDPTAPGDSNGDITETNLKWGNLINLSHNDYGLSNLTLRPAVLNSGSLLTEPLYSVKYANDGRISSVISDFAYTNYSTKDGANAFLVPESVEYGVRAISSVKSTELDTERPELLTLGDAVKQAYYKADNSFKALWNNKTYMNSITGLAGVYLQYRIDDTDQDCSSYVDIVNEMYGEFRNVYLLTGEIFVASANVYHYVYCNDNQQTFVPFTSDDLYSGKIKTTLAAEGVTLDGLDPYIKDYTLFIGTEAKNYEDGLYTKYKTNVYEPYTKNTSIGWELMRDYINPVADINSATIDGKAASVLGAGDLASIAFGSPVCELQKGLIWNMDWYYGGNISVSGVSAKAMGFTVNIREIRTSAKAKVEDPANKTYTNYPIIEVKNKAVNKAQAGIQITAVTAADTYGMVVDFWLRTNAEDALLSLAGKVQTEKVPMVDGEGNPITDDNGNQMYETVVLGYSGENRIWEEDDELSALGPSTSQGSGSCYIFYPETPEDQAQALEMLSAMRVAFVDEEGNLLAQADMDTSMAFEQEGRVLVPLQLRAKVITGIDENGDPFVKNAYYITEMVQNEATRITAIVYLDGARLENSNVLAAGSIKGQLNIQFGTSEEIDLDAADDNDLMDDYYEILIEAEGKTEFDSFDPENKPQVKLNLSVVGMEPNNIKGQFVSYISETQGANQPEFAFEKTDNGWEATVTFDGSGSFKLRNIRIDGVDYALKEDQIITVEIAGVTINNLTCTGWDGKNSKTLMTAESYYQLDSTLWLNTSSGQNPKKVQAVFAHDQGQNITVDYTLTANGWIASTMFTTSGTYEMTYVIIDGVYIPLPEEMQKTLTLYLGLKAQIFLSQPMTEDYQAALAVIEDKEAADIAAYKAANPNATDEEFAAAVAAIQATYKPEKDKLYDEAYGADGLNMTVNSAGYSVIYDGAKALYMNVSCIITDDKGNAMTGLNDVVLHYGIGSSVVNRIDTNLTWNSAIGRYEGPIASDTESTGRFKINRPGVYTFQSVEIGKDEDRNIITAATSAPKITAISPVPISYIGKATNTVVVEGSDFLYKESVVDINSAAKRYMSVVLKDAPSAEVYLKLYNSDKDVEDPETEWLGAQKVDLSDDKYLYHVNTPTDGTWKIVGMRVRSAFYNGVFYDGSEGEGSTGWLDWSDKVVADNIETKFFTTVKFSAINSPQTTYRGSFMEDHIVSGMKITISDYLDKAIEDVSVELSYTWQESTNDVYTLVSGTHSNTKFGGNLETKDGKTFSMETMNFQHDGDYIVKFAVTIGDTTYNDINSFVIPASGGFTAQMVTVYVEELPDISVSGVSNVTVDNSGNKSYTKFSVNLESDGDDKWKELSGVQNYYEADYANVYISGTAANENTLPKVTLKLSDLCGANSAYVVVNNKSSSKYNKTFTFTNDNKLTAESEIGGLEPGSVAFWRQYRQYADEQKISKINMVYDGATYEVRLKNTTTINQKQAPYYMNINVNDSDYITNGGEVPGTVISLDGKTITFPKKTTINYTRYESDNSATFSATTTTRESGKLFYYKNGSKYYGYTKKGTLWSKNAYTTPYDVSKSLSQWVVDGITYDSGDTIEVSKTLTATAKVTTSEIKGTATLKTLYKWVYEFVATGDSSYTEGKYGIQGKGYSIKLSSLTPNPTESVESESSNYIAEHYTSN